MRWRELTRCRDCGATIAFARVSTSDRIMPVEPRDIDGGNVAIMRDTAGHLVCRVLRKDGPPAAGYETVTVHHAAVCPARHDGQGTLL